MNESPYEITLNLRRRLHFDFFQYRPYIGDCPNCKAEANRLGTLLCWEMKDDYWTYCCYCRGADYASRRLSVVAPPHVSMAMYRMWMLYLTMVTITKKMPKIIPKDLLPQLNMPKDLRHPVHTKWLKQVLAVNSMANVRQYMFKRNIECTCDMPPRYRQETCLFMPIHGPLPGMLHGFQAHHRLGVFTIKLKGTEYKDGYFHLWTWPTRKYKKYPSLQAAFAEHPYHILAGQDPPNVVVPFKAPPEPSEDPPAT